MQYVGINVDAGADVTELRQRLEQAGIPSGDIFEKEIKLAPPHYLFFRLLFTLGLFLAIVLIIHTFSRLIFRIGPLEPKSEAMKL